MNRSRGSIGTGPPAPERSEVRAKTLPAQAVVNRVVRALLCVPVVGGMVGKRLVTIYFAGRRSGRRYAVPVAYTRQDGRLFVASQFAWIRNLQGGAPVEIRLRGRRRPASVEFVSDEAAVVDHLDAICRQNKQFAAFNRIGFDATGRPLPDDLHLAWAAGARGAVLTPS